MFFSTNLREHAACTFFRGSLLMVLASDDPAFWQVDVPTDDFLVAFVCLMAENQGLKAIKKLIKNSILYSLFEEEEKQNLMTNLIEL